MDKIKALVAAYILLVALIAPALPTIGKAIGYTPDAINSWGAAVGIAAGLAALGLAWLVAGHYLHRKSNVTAD